MNVPGPVWQMATALLVLFLVASAAVFMLGWLRTPKQVKGRHAGLMFLGGLTMLSGLGIYTGNIALNMLTGLQSFRLGIILTPLGWIILSFGLTRPLQLDVELVE